MDVRILVLADFTTVCIFLSLPRTQITIPMKRARVDINLMTKEDNKAILDLSHRCIQEGVLSVYPDRTPEFTRIHKQLDEGTFHLVARDGDKLVGCLGAIHTPVQYEGKVFNSIYFLDFKVDPEYQGSITAYRLVKDMYVKFKENEEIGFATIIKGNDASHIFTRGRADFPGSTNLGDIIFTNIIPFRKRKVNPSYKIEAPVEADIPEMAELYAKFYRTYKLGPVMSEDLLRRYLTEIQGIELENMRVARKDGKIKAVLCAWDEDVYKRWMVMKIPFGMKMAFVLVRILSLVFKMPAPLKTGKALRQKTLVMMAHDHDLEAMKSLVRHVHNEHRGTQYTVLQAHLHAEDKMSEALQGMFGLKVNVEMHTLTNDPKLSENIQKAPGPVLFEWPFYI